MLASSNWCRACVWSLGIWKKEKKKEVHIGLPLTFLLWASFEAHKHLLMPKPQRFGRKFKFSTMAARARFSPLPPFLPFLFFFLFFFFLASFSFPSFSSSLPLSFAFLFCYNSLSKVMEDAVKVGNSLFFVLCTDTYKRRPHEGANSWEGVFLYPNQGPSSYVCVCVQLPNSRD